MSKLLFDGIFNFVETYLRSIGNSTKNLDILFYVFVGVELLFVIYFLIKSHFAYQFRLIRSIDKINIYLLNNSYINENNLIEFNKKMKRVPKTFRYHWQQYMLYREQAPSFYMSSTNVIDKPLRSSSVKNNLKTMKALTVIFATLGFLLSAAVLGLAPSTLQSSFVSTIIFRLAIIPCLVVLIGSLYAIYQNARQTANLSDLYQTFHIFQRLIDKAVTTMPEYVDFEVLFTKKEIAKGIPALNAYLEKRARQEQEELEKARRNAVDHEVYDFGSVDISGSLILDRAMKETEIYLSLRNRLLAEIQQVESQIDTLKKSYDNTQREIQRKMQTAKENIERIRMQQESSTNRIEGNYLKKQQDQEISKLTQLEKDNTEETYRFNQELEALTSEIDKKRAELEERRKYIEKAMLAEYKTYSTKVFKNLLKVANEKDKVERDTLNETKDNYAQQIVELKEQVQELSYENTQLKDRIKNFDSELSEKENFYTNALIETAEKAKSALVGKKGDSTEEFEPIEDVEYAQPVEEAVEDVQSEDEVEGQDIVSDFTSEEPEIETPNIEETPVENEEEQPPVDEYEGYYDSEGYYRYPNGTYYDPQGRYFDETGGYFDIDGNYHDPDEARALLEEIEREKQEAEAEKQAELDAQTEAESEPQQENVEEPQQEEVKEEVADAQSESQPEISPEVEQELFDNGEEQEVETKDNQTVVPTFEEDEEEYIPLVVKKSKGKKQKHVVVSPVEEVEDDEDDYEDYGEFEDYEEDDYDDNEYEEDEEEESRGPGRPRKSNAGRPKSTKGPGRPAKKKGPGRPAGSTKTSTTGKVGRPKKEETRGPGRPKKEEVRGPGRPKKEEKRGPGRPKKEEARGPGRPKKEEKRGPGRPPKKKGPGRPKKK